MKDKLKVLLVSPYSEHSVGGIINWTKYIVNYYREHDDKIDLQLLNNDNAVQVMGATGLVKRIISGIGNYLPIIRQFKKKIEKDSFDVVHICTSASLGLIRDLMLIKLAKKQRVKILVHMHFGRIPQILASRGLEKCLLMRVMKWIDMAIVMDRASLVSLQDAGFKNVCFLPNPFSSDVQRLIEKQGVLNREPRKIVYAGHVVASKGVFELVEACKDIDGVTLEILGKLTSESIKEELISAAGDHALEWVYIPGNKPLEDVIREMMTCGVFVLPSYSEGFPNVILEAMACGTPIVATPVGAIAEMLDVNSDNPCGECVPVRDIAVLRETIKKLLSDPVKAKTIGDNARRRVNEMYAIPKVWGQLVGIWENIPN